jgi:hypothetical protein
VIRTLPMFALTSVRRAVRHTLKPLSPNRQKASKWRDREQREVWRQARRECTGACWITCHCQLLRGRAWLRLLFAVIAITIRCAELCFISHSSLLPRGQGTSDDWGALVMNSSDIQQSPARTVPLATIPIGVFASCAGATRLWLLLRLL